MTPEEIGPMPEYQHSNVLRSRYNLSVRLKWTVSREVAKTKLLTPDIYKRLINIKLAKQRLILGTFSKSLSREQHNFPFPFDFF